MVDVNGDKLAKVIRMGDRAEALRRDEAFMAAIEQAKTECVDDMVREKDPVRRNELWNERRGIERFEQRLIAIMNNGKFAKRQIEGK